MIVDPHTAVGLTAYRKRRGDMIGPVIALATAHPAKFPAAVEAASGINPALPDWLGDLNARKERVTVLPADQGAIEKFILAASRAAREGAAA